MDSLLARFGLEDQAWVDPVIGLIIFGIAILVSALSHYVIIPLAQRLSHHTETELDDLVFRAVRRPVSLIILVLGSYLAVVIPTDLTAGQQDVVNALFTAAAILASLVLITRLLSVSLDWYISRLSVDQRSATAHILPILRKVAVIVVYAIGVMLMLDAAGHIHQSVDCQPEPRRPGRSAGDTADPVQRLRRPPTLRQRTSSPPATTSSLRAASPDT